MSEENGNAVATANRMQLPEVAMFDLDNRKAKMLAASVLFPEHLRKGSPEQNIANALTVVSLARELNENPLVLAQHIYLVHGKAAWSSSYLIAKANASGKFSDPIDWEIKGSGESMEVTAFAKVASTGRRVAVSVSMKMAKAEGWSTKPGNKYASMPELMLRYRSATMLFRLYCPEVMLGMRAVEEIEDIANTAESFPTRTASLESKLGIDEPAKEEVIDADGEIHDAPVTGESFKLGADK